MVLGQLGLVAAAGPAMAMSCGIFTEDIMTTINIKVTVKHPRGVWVNTPLISKNDATGIRHFLEGAKTCQ